VLHYEGERGKEVIEAMRKDGLKCVEIGEGTSVKGKHSILYVTGDTREIAQVGPFANKEQVRLWLTGHGKVLEVPPALPVIPDTPVLPPRPPAKPEPGKGVVP
jgi:hypothetical protein